MSSQSVPLPSLILYSYWRSSSAFRVRIGLYAKGLPFELRCVNLLERAHEQAAYLERAPGGFLPCLELDGEAFVESVAILELIDVLSPSLRLFPEAPKARARVMELVETINSGTQPLQNLNVLQRFEESERAAWAKHFITRGLATYERLLARNEIAGTFSGSFSYGDSFTAADCYLVPQVYNAKRFGVDLTQLPRLAKVAEGLQAHPAVVKAMPEAQPDAPGVSK
jgi:maleylpyruvate isomerase